MAVVLASLRARSPGSGGFARLCPSLAPRARAGRFAPSPLRGSPPCAWLRFGPLSRAPRGSGSGGAGLGGPSLPCGAVPPPLPPLPAAVGARVPGFGFCGGVLWLLLLLLSFRVVAACWPLFPGAGSWVRPSPPAVPAGVSGPLPARSLVRWWWSASPASAAPPGSLRRGRAGLGSPWPSLRALARLGACGASPCLFSLPLAPALPRRRFPLPVGFFAPARGLGASRGRLCVVFVAPRPGRRCRGRSAGCPRLSAGRSWRVRCGRPVRAAVWRRPGAVSLAGSRRPVLCCRRVPLGRPCGPVRRFRPLGARVSWRRLVRWALGRSPWPRRGRVVFGLIGRRCSWLPSLFPPSPALRPAWRRCRRSPPWSPAFRVAVRAGWCAALVAPSPCAAPRSASRPWSARAPARSVSPLCAAAGLAGWCCCPPRGLPRPRGLPAAARVPGRGLSRPRPGACPSARPCRSPRRAQLPRASAPFSSRPRSRAFLRQRVVATAIATVIARAIIST